MGEQGKSLEYGLVAAGTRRRRVVRWVALALLVVGAGVVVYHHREILARVKYARAWSRLAEHRPAEKEIIFSSHSEDVARLRGDPRYTHVALSVGGHVVRTLPADWGTVFGVGISNEGLAFVGKRTTPDGRESLVGVQVSYEWMPIAAMVRDGPWVADRTPKNNGGGTGSVDLLPRMGDGMRIFAGRADPDDASAFSIEYEIGGRRGTVKGRLRERGWVEFEMRPAPHE